MKLSLVLPVFNERESLQELNQKILDSVIFLNEKFEIIYVDDGSEDGSLLEMQKIKQNNPNKNIKIVRLRKNLGRSFALAAGFEVASGDIIISMDADLQDDPSEIIRFVQKIEEGFDIVSGWKKNRQDPKSKIIQSKLFNGFVRLCSGIKLNDINSGYKAYKKEVVKSIKLYGELHRFLPLLAIERGFNKICEIEVKHYPRRFGKSKFGWQRFIRAFWDFITVMFLLKFYQKPMHFFGYASLFFLILSILSVFLSFTFRSINPLLFLILVFIIVQPIFLGILGEIIIRSSSEKDFFIREIL